MTPPSAREAEARRWWRQARRDLESAELNARHERHEVACFLAQQAAEKALKAYLYAQGEDAVIGHSLLALLRRAAGYAEGLRDLREGAKILDTFYVPSRYANGLADEIARFDFFDAADSGGGLDSAGASSSVSAPCCPRP